MTISLIGIDDPLGVGVITGENMPTPRGFLTHVANIGIKDETDDFVIIASSGKCSADAVFTRSRFAGPSVLLSRRHMEMQTPRAIVTVSKNANVATGKEGMSNAEELARSVADLVGCTAAEVLVASTGIIGRQYPMDRIRAYLALNPVLQPADFPAASKGIMTTDTVPKMAGVRLGPAVIAGIAKGVGMIEPNMATLLVYICTDAQVPQEHLQPVFRRIVNCTFNCLSIDTDTSTSDTAVILANGLAGPVDLKVFEHALYAVALSLVKQLAHDGEGATKLLEVTTIDARDEEQAKRVAKAVLNSPLVKAAVHGADPNWGRVAMAISKCFDDEDILPERVCISFGGLNVYPDQMTSLKLEELSAIMRAGEINITISLGTGTASAVVWGCDLSEEYVRFNAQYAS